MTETVEEAHNRQQWVRHDLKSAMSDFEGVIEAIPVKEATRFQRDALRVEAFALCQRLGLLHGVRLG